MKKLLMPLLAGAIAFGATQVATARPVLYKLDEAHMSSGFYVDHHDLSIMNVVFLHTSGKIWLDVQNPSKSKVEAKVYTNTVLYPAYKGFTEHLKSSDYLNTREFPVATFKSTKFVRTGDKTALVYGNLKLLGKTKPMVMYAEFLRWGSHKGVKGFAFKGHMEVDRRVYGVTKYMKDTDNPYVTFHVNGEALLPDFDRVNPNKKIRNNYRLR